MSQVNSNVEFVLDVFNNPPPNQNPLIGRSRGDTTENGNAVLALISHVMQNEEVYATDGASHGLYLVVECVKNANLFEENYRDYFKSFDQLDESIRKMDAHQERMDDSNSYAKLLEAKRREAARKILKIVEHESNDDDKNEDSNI